LLGALVTVGILMLTGVVALLTLLLSARRGADAVASGITNASIGANLLMALLVSSVVLVSFGTGGYVAGRFAEAGGRMQGLFVWAGVMAPPAVGLLLAAMGNGVASTVVDALSDDPALLSLFVSVLAGGLLGALLGADAAERHRTAALLP
jgi:hypothetical protein